ncbi:MAG: hypothetical protein TREMPRED_005474 [Tremellales sp. Tagirdzhanova-0007]|nr:MAG: hypothetical protein TREMPRED_005474 [Tremellales sp. Tagirdzhanova-0007]
MRKINLIVGDLLKSKKGSPTPISRFQASLLNIITYFSSHSVAPGSLRKEIDARPTLGKERTLIRPGITRWTSHYAAAGRVWELHDAYQALQDEDKWRPLLLTFASDDLGLLAGVQKLGVSPWPARIWRQLGSTRAARNSPLRKLALRLNAAIPNSAGNERLFSVFADIVTKKRNRMSIKTMASLQRLRSEYRSEAMTRWAKRANPAWKPNRLPLLRQRATSFG